MTSPDSQPSLTGRVALVTGASSGIGRAVACALSARGARLRLVGRDAGRLDETRTLLARPDEARCHPLDISDKQAVRELADSFGDEEPNVLVHSAGIYGRGTMTEAGEGDFDRLLKINVAGVYELNRVLLSRLIAARGDVVFVNSSIVNRATAATGQFAATQHALRAIADSLREEVNEHGVRVLSVYPGRTATPRQEGIFADEGRAYTPDKLLQADDLADTIAACLALPRTAEVTDLHIRPALK